jgi:hypothetical protein
LLPTKSPQLCTGAQCEVASSPSTHRADATVGFPSISCGQCTFYPVAFPPLTRVRSATDIPSDARCQALKTSSFQYAPLLLFSLQLLFCPAHTASLFVCVWGRLSCLLHCSSAFGRLSRAIGSESLLLGTPPTHRRRIKTCDGSTLLIERGKQHVYLQSGSAMSSSGLQSKKKNLCQEQPFETLPSSSITSVLSKASDMEKRGQAH